MRATSGSANPEAMIPDLMVHKYKGATLMGEVKRNGIHAGYANYKKTSKAVETKATSVKTEYTRKARKLDTLYAPEADDPGPFESSLTSFHGGGVTPFCFGAFGETNRATDDFVKFCAKKAATRQEGLEMSRLQTSAGYLGAYSLMVRCFRIALAVLGAKKKCPVEIKKDAIYSAYKSICCIRCKWTNTW